MKNIIIAENLDLALSRVTLNKTLDKNILIDAHCHLFNLWEKLEHDPSKLDKAIKNATAARITKLISSALSPEEYDWHLQLKYPQVLLSAGIHPFYKKEEQDFDKLEEVLKTNKIIAVGEIGLDKNCGDLQSQKNLLLKQLDLARSYNLPVVFHCVKYYYELYKLLKQNFPKIRGYLHSFSSSEEVMERFSEFDLAFSVSSRLPNPKTMIKIIKRGMILLETDAPYALSKEIKNTDFNEPKHLISNLENIVNICKIDKQTIISAQFYSFNELFGIENTNESS